MRTRSLVASLALASFSLITPSALAQGFEKALPGDSLAFVGADDVTKIKEALIASPHGMLWHDPACASLRDAAAEGIAAWRTSVINTAGIDPVMLLEAIKGPAAFAVLELTEPVSTGPASLSMGGAFALLLDIGQDGEAVMTQIEAALDKAKDQPGITRSAETAGDVEVTLLELGDPADPERMQVRFGLANNVFVAVAGSASVAAKDYMGTIVANLAQNPDDALAESDAFAKSLAGTEGTGVRVFVDTRTLISRARAFAAIRDPSAEGRKIADGLGLENFDTVSMFSEYAGEGAESEVSIAWNGDGPIVSGVQTLLPPGKSELFTLVTDTAVSAIDAHVDIAATFDHVLATLKDLGMVSEEELNANMEMAETELGMSIRDDLLANLGTEIAFFMAPVEDDAQGIDPSADEPSNFAVIQRLKDGKKVEGLLDELIVKSGMNAARKRTDFQGFNINSIPLPIPGMGTVNYVITDDLLVFSLAPELVQGIVRRTASGSDLPNLAGKPEVEASLGDGPQEASVFMISSAAASVKDMFANARNLVTYMSRSGRSRKQMTPEETKFLDTLRNIEFPSDEVIEKYVKGYTFSWLSVGEDGTHVHSKQ